jgi:hypothetical protein
MLGAHATVVRARELQLLVQCVLHHLLGAELQNVCGVMVNEGNGVVQAHGKGFRGLGVR